MIYRSVKHDWRNEGSLKVLYEHFALDEHNEALITDEMKEAVAQARADIISGKIEVHDYMATKSCPF